MNDILNEEVTNEFSPELGKTLFKPGTVLYIKDPWLKICKDGRQALRVEDSKDLAFLRAASSCSYCYTSRTGLLRCSRCAGAFY